MGYAALVLAVSGFVIGTFLRLQLLLAAAALTLLLSILFCFSSGMSFLSSLVTIMAAQTVVQGSYFLGLLSHAAITSRSQRHIL